MFLNPRKQALFYEGYCKSVLWPLFHSSPPTTDDVMSAHGTYEEVGEVEEERWQVGEEIASANKFHTLMISIVFRKAYISANRIYAEAIHEIYKDGDIVWLHDYHLMLVAPVSSSSSSS